VRLTGGEIRKKNSVLREKMPRKRITAIPAMIPSELQHVILGYVNPRFGRNCAEFFTLVNGKNKIQEIQRNPSMLKDFKRFVFSSLCVFYQRLCGTKLIKYCSAGRSTMIITRVNKAITLAEKSNDAQELMELCKMIVTWKEECRKIQELLSHIATRLPLGPLTKNDCKGLSVYGGQSYLLTPRYVTKMLKRISNDTKRMEKLLSPIHPLNLQRI
jgi:hypothetical protein